MAFIGGKNQSYFSVSDNGLNSQNIALNNLSDWIALTTWQLSSPTLHHCERTWRWFPPEPIQDFDFWLILEGTGHFRVGGSRFDLKPGSWFLLQPGDRPEAQHDPDRPLVVFACHFQPEKTSGRLSQRILSGLCPVPLRSQAELAARTFQEGPSGRALASTTLRQIMLQVAHALTLEPAGSGRRRLDELAMEIRAAPGRDWSLAEMARRCALSPAHLNRLWRAAWGTTPGQYVIRQRIARAIHLLRESDLTLQNIAESLGYNDVFFFHRQFRRISGETPRAVRLGSRTRLDPKSHPEI